MNIKHISLVQVTVACLHTNSN